MLGPKENAWSRVHATIQTLFPLLKDYSWANDDLDLGRELAFARGKATESKEEPEAISLAMRAMANRRPQAAGDLELASGGLGK